MTEQEHEFEGFVAARYTALVRTAALLLGSPQQAEDLVQSALIRTYLRWGALRQHSNAEAYTRTVMVRLALRWGRRHWRAEVPTAVPDAIAVDDASDKIDAADEMSRVLERLPAAQRAVLVLRFYNQLREAEVARLLRCRPGTVKSRTARGMASLRAAGLLIPIAKSSEPVHEEDWYVR